MIGSAIGKTLTDAGHNVTFISAFPLKAPPPNYKDIELTGVTEFFKSLYKVFQFNL